MKKLKLSIIVITLFILFSFIKGSNKGSLKIVYNVQLNDSCSNYEVFIMDLDGNNKKNLSNWKGADWVYATFEDKIYFVSDRDSLPRQWYLYEMDSNGNNIKRISKIRLQDSYVAIKANGKEIMVCPYSKAKKCFLTINIKTGNIVDSLNIPFANIADPCFLPGDKQIIFRGAKEKKGIEELFFVNIDGSNLKQITNYPKSDTTAKWYETHTGTPVWNQQQKIISYFSKQKNNHSIFTISLNGNKSKQITDDLLNERWHDWSPDGKYIVYDGSDLADKNFDIYLMNADGTNIKRLTKDTLVEQAPLFVKQK